jgi:glycosyltransferase involved in cell wall biosynthesis
MKIAFLSPFYPYRGGISQFSNALYEELSVDNHIKAFNFTRQYPNFLFPGKSQYVEGNTETFTSERILDSINPLSYKKTAQRINDFLPDLFISSYWMPFFAPSLGFVAKKINKKTIKIAILHNVNPHEKRFFDKRFNRYFLKQFDGYIVLSESVEIELKKIFPQAKVSKLFHPVYNHFGDKMNREEACLELNIDATKKIVLFFGLIRDYKGLEILIEATKYLDDSYQILVVGECYGSFDKYQIKIDEYQLNKRIKVENRYISENQVAKYFSAADVCVLPYKSATQSGITAIAQHFCLPIIATNVGALSETILDKQTGTIVESFNPIDFSNAIKNYFDESKKDSFSANIKKVNEQKSWKVFANQLLEFYLQLKV